MAKKKRRMTLKNFILAFIGIIFMLVLMPTTIVMFVGMLPTLVAYVVDRSPEKNKTFTIGALNFSGCFPFLLNLWIKDNTMVGAFNIIQNPETIIIIYALAALGYMINWAATIAVSSLMIQKSETRIKRIEQEKQALQNRWGQEVDGKHELDTHGFPVDKINEKSTT